MLSTVPSKKKTKPRNWIVMILVGVIIILPMAFSGLTGLYFLNNHATQPNIIVVNQTPNNTSDNPSIQQTSQNNNITAVSTPDAPNDDEQPVSKEKSNQTTQ